jgi:hypothetical protein
VPAIDTTVVASIDPSMVAIASVVAALRPLDLR